jgi:hypothetical protein
MLSSITTIKIRPMRTVCLFMVIFGIVSCTNTRNEEFAVGAIDTAIRTALPAQHTAAAPVVAPVKTEVNISLELPLFKDVLDLKRLF